MDILEFFLVTENFEDFAKVKSDLTTQRTLTKKEYVIIAYLEKCHILMSGTIDSNKIFE